MGINKLKVNKAQSDSKGIGVYWLGKYYINITTESTARTRLTVEDLSPIISHGAGYIPQSLPNSYGPAWTAKAMCRGSQHTTER